MSAMQLAHVRRLTIHDTIRGATSKALFFCIAKHFLQEAEIHARITGVIIFQFFCFVFGFESSALLDGSYQYRLIYCARAGHGLFLFSRSRCTYCGASLHFTIWRASRRGWDEQQHKAKKFPLSRIDVHMIEGKSSEILLEMDSYRLQIFAKSFGAQSALSIPASTGRRGQTAFQMYIYICLGTRQLLLMYYMHAQHIFAP